MPTPHKTLIIAHRGKVTDYQENSAAAIEAAMRDPRCDGVEFDVFLMRDGEVVVFHDENMARLTGCDQSIYEMTQDELKQFRLQKSIMVDGGLKHYAQEQPIALLRDVLASIKGQQRSNGQPYFVNIELKAYDTNPFRYGVGTAVATIVKEMGMQHQCVLSSFNYFMLAAAKAVAPEIRTVAAFDDDMPLSNTHLNHLLENAYLGKLIQASGVLAEHTLMDDDSVTRIKNHGLLSGSYTYYPLNCNALEKTIYDSKLLSLYHQGLDWVETDNIGYAYELLNR